MKQELAEGEDYYLNTDGLLVFTVKFLSNRGYCCGSGCLHCPYNYDAVAEPKRSELLIKRNTNSNNSEINSGRV
jgi:hypothetical protein